MGGAFVAIVMSGCFLFTTTQKEEAKTYPCDEIEKIFNDRWYKIYKVGSEREFFKDCPFDENFPESECVYPYHNNYLEIIRKSSVSCELKVKAYNNILTAYPYHDKIIINNLSARENASNVRLKSNLGTAMRYESEIWKEYLKELKTMK